MCPCQLNLRREHDYLNVSVNVVSLVHVTCQEQVQGKQLHIFAHSLGFQVLKEAYKVLCNLLMLKSERMGILQNIHKPIRNNIRQAGTTDLQCALS
jgi:hypothetical protein